MPTVPWPAMMAGSSNGEISSLFSLRDRFVAYSEAPSKLSPTSRTSAPQRSTASTFTAGAVWGITTMARQPSWWALIATPMAWLPADAATTPRRSWAFGRDAILL